VWCATRAKVAFISYPDDRAVADDEDDISFGIPYAHVMCAMMLTALWSGLGKPEMETLLSQLLMNCTLCMRKAFNGTIMENLLSQVILCLFYCDSVAMPCLQM